MTRLDNVDRLSSLDKQVIGQVVTFKGGRSAPCAPAEARAHLRRRPGRPAPRRAAPRSPPSWPSASGCSSSIKSEISTLEAQEAARQLQMARDAQAQIAAAQRRSSRRRRQPSSARAPRPRRARPSFPPRPTAARWSRSRCRTSAPRTSGAAPSPGGFDCSGLVMYSFAQLGVSLPHSSYAQYNYGSYVAVQRPAAGRPRLLRRARARRALHRRRRVRRRPVHRRLRAGRQPDERLGPLALLRRPPDHHLSERGNSPLIMADAFSNVKS